MTAMAKYTAEEIHLLSSLAIGIARRLTSTCAMNSNRLPTGYIHHEHATVFEKGCWVLWTLNVATAATNQQSELTFAEFSQAQFVKPEPYPVYFRPLDDTSIAQRLEAGIPSDACSLDDAIEAYLGLATDFGPPEYTHLATPRKKSFLLQYRDHERPLLAFAETGHVVKESSRFRWTDKIAPNMIARWLWDETDFILSEVDLSEASREAKRIRDSLSDTNGPETVGFLSQLSISWRALEIMRRWSGDGWVQRTPGKIYVAPNEAMAIATLLEGDLSRTDKLP